MSKINVNITRRKFVSNIIGSTFGIVCTSCHKFETENIPSEEIFYRRLLKVFGTDSIIAYFPTNELSGNQLTDFKNGHNCNIYNTTYNIDAINRSKALGFGDISYGNIYNVSQYMNKDEGSIIFFLRSAKLGTVGGLGYLLSFRNIIEDVEMSLKVTVDYNICWSSKRNGESKGIIIRLYSDTFLMVCITWSVINNRITGFVNGCPFNNIPIATGFSSWDSEFRNDLCGLSSYRGSIAENVFQGDYSDLVFLNREVSESELRKICVYDQLIIEGDSRATSKIWDYEAVSQNLISVRCAAVSGSTPADCLARANTTVDPYYFSNLKNVVVVWFGTNGGGSAATIYNQLKTYCLARKAVGFQVIVCTEISKFLPTDAWNTTTMPALNTMLRNDHSFADALADLGAYPEFQFDGLDPVYFLSDKIHLTRLGYSMVASTVRSALQNIGFIP